MVLADDWAQTTEMGLRTLLEFRSFGDEFFGDGDAEREGYWV